MAILCPRCSAPLDAKASSRLVTCQFCHTDCRVPDRSWAELDGAAVSEPWFLLFDAGSPDRQELLAKRDAAMRRRAHEERARALDAERAKAPASAKGRQTSGANDRAFVAVATTARRRAPRPGAARLADHGATG